MVDDKYVENVTDGQEVFEMLGAEPSYFEGTGITFNEDYEPVNIRDAYADEYFTGKPQLSNIITSEYATGELDENGEEIKEANYRVDLVISDDDRMEELIIGLNLKSDGQTQTKVHSSSKLFELVKGLAEMECKGCMDNFNYFNVVNLDKIRKTISETPVMRVKIVEKSFRGRLYNSFVVVNPNNE